MAIPKALWQQLAKQQGGNQVQDLILFFVYRCSSANSETVIPWEGLRDQFPQDDTNPRRFKQTVKIAVRQLLILWPSVQINIVKEGVWVRKSREAFLPDDPGKGRIRRLK